MRPFVVFAWLLAGCSPQAHPPPPPVLPRAVPVTTGVARATDARVEVTLAGPSRVLYSPATMRAPRPVIRIAVANPMSSPLDVSDLRVRLDVTRGSQRVRCEDAGADETTRRREPRALGPRASAVFMRTIDCPLALAGTYVVQVVVAFGNEEPFASGIVSKELALTVVASPDAQPRAIAGVPGLHAAIGSGGVVPSSSGPGRIVVALVNARSDRLALPTTQVSLRVRKVGTDIPCEDEPQTLALPAYLEPNAVLTRPVDVSCLGLGVTGSYDVEARLLIGDDLFPIGSLRIDVSTDPSHRNRRLLP
jgi:hypothetical protein